MINSKNKDILLAVLLILIVGFIARFSALTDEGGVKGLSWWEKVSDQAAGISFEYPKKVSTKYVHLLDWPPKVGMLNIPFTCVEEGKETVGTGRTMKKTIEGRDYCITKLTEGAAGSIYTQYAYATEVEGKFVYFTFSIHIPNCGNYDEMKRNACNSECSKFNIDPIIHQIVQTVKFL